MPYKIEKMEGGWKVCDSNRCFSKKPMSKKNANKQRVAIALSEQRKTGKPVKSFFV